MSRIKEPEQFKLDYANITSDEHLNKYRQSKLINMKNLSVANELSVGLVHIDKSHITTTSIKDPVIYFDDQVNILQSAYTEDTDVIGTDKNTSFVDYRNLSKTYYTKIGGQNGEYIHKNNKCVDVDNNLYVILESTSSLVKIYDSTNNNVPVSDLLTTEGMEDDGLQDVVIVKYNHLGEFIWSTHVGGYYDKFYPSLVCDNDGNVVVSFGNSSGGNHDVLIFDTSNNNVPVARITDAADDSCIIVKYDSNGLFLWTIHVDGVYQNGGPSSSALPTISCDVDGNVFLAHPLYGRELKIYDKTPAEYIPRPSDFFCVMLNHFHTGTLRYTQPIYTYSTGLSQYNFVTMKFDKDGKFKWINHIEMQYQTDYSPECYIDNDVDGNIILTGNFAGYLKVFNPLNVKLSKPDATLLADERSDGADNIFIIKYDTNGSVMWETKVATFSNDVTDTSTITDSNGNIYLTYRSRDNENYLWDTTNKIESVKDFNLKLGNRSFVIVKYNKDGVIQWYTSVDGLGNKYQSHITIDNRFIKGNEHSNIYLSGEFDENINFYNSSDLTHISYTLPFDDINNDDNVFISCFNQDGQFSWATKAAAAAVNTDEFTSNVFDPCIASDKDGHVYLMGGYSSQLNIYDSQSNGKPVGTLTKSDDNVGYDDVFILKYNRYGLLNTSNPKLLYIEDNSDLPDSFCKEVILTNNDNNGIVNLQIMKKENYGYSVRRNVLITEAIELITKGGIWIPKIISDQYEYVNDLDVIDTNTKTSFVNYQNLQNSFYTKIGGSGSEVNPEIHLDKNDNVYMAGIYNSDKLQIYDFTNQNVPVGSLDRDGDQSLFITKYDASGVNQWYTRIGGYWNKKEPSVFASGKGDVFVSMQSNDLENIHIYDVNHKQNPVKELLGFTGFSGFSGFSGGDYSNTVFVKYNDKGEFQWNTRMVSVNINGPTGPTDSSFTSTATTTGDLEGNLFVSGYFDGETIAIFDTGNDELPAKTFNKSDFSGSGPSGAYFICKFDYTGKFLWINHLAGGLIPANHSQDTDYLKFFRINLNTDYMGNLYLTSSFYGEVAIFNPDSTEIENVIFNEGQSLGIFNIKYNSSGIYQWHNGVFSNSDGVEGTVESGSCVDADGNLYISFSNYYLYTYVIIDTRDSSLQPIFSYNNESESDSFVSIVKFNHKGIFQWNNVIKVNENHNDYDETFNPYITCDNQYITGQCNANIYVHLNGYISDYRGGFNFYNASSTDTIAYTLPCKDNWLEDNTVHSILSKFDRNGNFQWATTAAGYEYDFDYRSNIMGACVKADSSGHVYVSGIYYDTDLSIWDVSRNGYDDDEVGFLDNTGNTDCYLIKYNRYGLVNNNTHRDIYLEDVPNIPNAFEKSIVITNNTNNGPVNCQILEPLSSGFGYNVRKNITLTDCLDLVSSDGKWIPKIQSEQITVTRDYDVIDPNTKLSVLDFDRDLNSASWTTRISGNGNERNIRLSSDKYDNVYALCSFDSNTAYFNDMNSGNNSNDNENIERYNNNREIALVKYLKDGEFKWVTRIAFDTNFSGQPAIYTDAEGNTYVTIVKTDDEVVNDVFIFDTRSRGSPFKTANVTNKGALVIKYDKDGLYLWDIKISARFNSSGTYGTNVVADKNGNVYLSGFILNSSGIEIWDASNYIKEEITTDDGDSMFIVKFDKTGKYLWSIPLYYGVETDENISLSCDIDGNIIVSALQRGTVTVNHRVDNDIRFYKDISKDEDSNISLFTVKYDTNGKCLWTNRLGSNAGGGASGEIFYPSSAIDSYGNYYLAVQISGAYAYIYDTRSEDVTKFNIEIPTNGTPNTFFAKYNKNGIVQWYNYVSGYSTAPCICVDNKFTQGINDNSVYLCGSYSGNEGYINIYRSEANGDFPNQIYTLDTNGYNSYLLRYDHNGDLLWSSKVGGSDTVLNNSVVATSDGHVYLGGEFNTELVNVYQGRTLDMNPNSDIAVSIYNSYEDEGDYTFDIFLIKYNRYGIVNNGNVRGIVNNGNITFGKEIYLENNSSIKNGTEKTIVVINNNEFNGNRENVCLIVLNKNNEGYGYSSFRNIWFSEGVSLVSYDGQWFIKSSSNDILPKRSIIMWGGDDENIPGGWRLCDGGSLNNVTTPDLRGRFVLGFNNGATGANGSSADGGYTALGEGARVATNLAGVVGNNGGEVLHTLTINEMPTHNHEVTDPGHTHSYLGVGGQSNFGGGADTVADEQNRPNETTGSSLTGITIQNRGGSQPHNNLPAFYVLCYIMKCF